LASLPVSSGTETRGGVLFACLLARGRKGGGREQEMAGCDGAKSPVSKEEEVILHDFSGLVSRTKHALSIHALFVPLPGCLHQFLPCLELPSLLITKRCFFFPEDLLSY